MKRQLAVILVGYFVLLAGICADRPLTAEENSALKKSSSTVSSFDDEFQGPTLGSQWEWYNEDRDKWSLTASPGSLRIIGTNCDPWKTCTNTRNLLLQKMPLGNFVMVTKLKITPTMNYQQGGLLVFKDLDNYLKLGVLWNTTTQGGLCSEFILEKHGRPVGEPDWPWIKIASSNPTFLKITKSGTVFTGYYSPNGVRWTRVGSWDAPTLSATRIGLFAYAATCRDSTPDIPVDFDYFRLSLTESP